MTTPAARMRNVGGRLTADRRFKRYGLPALVILLVVLFPFYATDRGAPLEFFFVDFLGMDIDTVFQMAEYVMLALGLNIVVGYAGLLDLGYVAFFALGAYTLGWFGSGLFSERNVHFLDVGNKALPGIHLSFWVVVPLAGLFCAIAGIIIGWPTLRLRGDYLAIVTLGFGEIMPQIARNGDNLFNTGFNLTNGAQGINPIDPPGFGSSLEGWVGLPEDYLTFRAEFLGQTISAVELYYWTGIVLLLFTIFCSVRLRESRLGRAWIAIREDETAAAAMGVPLMRTKTWAYAAGAFFGGIAGAYYASFKAGTFPDDFFFNISVFILCMVILGGLGTIWGVLVGGAFLSYLNQEGLANIGAWINERFAGGDPQWVKVFDEPIDVPLYQFGIFGVILVLVMLFRPEGLIPSARRKAEFQETLHDEPLVDVQK